MLQLHAGIYRSIRISTSAGTVDAAQIGIFSSSNDQHFRSVGRQHKNYSNTTAARCRNPITFPCKNDWFNGKS